VKTRDRTTAPHLRQAVDFRQAACLLRMGREKPILGKPLLPFVLGLATREAISTIWTREWSHRINPSLRVREMTIDALRNRSVLSQYKA